MKPYFALSLLAVMCCNVGAAEPQQTVVPIPPIRYWSLTALNRMPR
jgi:hypothetical protein